MLPPQPGESPWPSPPLLAKTVFFRACRPALRFLLINTAAQETAKFVQPEVTWLRRTRFQRLSRVADLTPLFEVARQSRCGEAER